MSKETRQPHIFDAQEWRHMAQEIAIAAVRLADNMAADHGQELELIRPPAAPKTELRYKGRPYRVGGGLDDPKREPPVLSYARSLAEEALALERQIGRMIDKALAELPAAERQQLALQLIHGGDQAPLFPEPETRPAAADPLLTSLPPAPVNPELN